MKKNFSVSWRSSRQARKQRKYSFNSPVHLRHKFLSANLSKELRKKHQRRSFPLRKGDTVKIMRGSFKNKKGKVSEVDATRVRIYVENVQITKKDGTKVNVPVRPSKVQIVELNAEDKKRLKSLNKKIEQKEKLKSLNKNLERKTK